MCVLSDMWVEGNPLQPQSLVPLLRRLASEPPPEMRELGLDADQACPLYLVSHPRQHHWFSDSGLL